MLPPDNVHSLNNETPLTEREGHLWAASEKYMRGEIDVEQLERAEKHSRESLSYKDQMVWRLRWFLMIAIITIFILSILGGLISYWITGNFYYLLLLTTTIFIPYIFSYLISMDKKRFEGKLHRRLAHWTGFSGKTLWDWLNLLGAAVLIPVIIATATIWFSAQQNQLAKQQHASDQYIAQQARYDDLLKTYRDGIDTLLLTNSLRTAPSGSDVRAIAHSRTLDVLRQVDTSRKGTVITYLANLRLVQGGYFDTDLHWHIKEPIVSLSGADLSRTDLNRADLRGTDLSGAYLIGVDLMGADLIGANLSRADLSEAYLRAADLNGVNLDSAILRSAIMPDGSTHP